MITNEEYIITILTLNNNIEMLNIMNNPFNFENIIKKFKTPTRIIMCL